MGKFLHGNLVLSMMGEVNTTLKSQNSCLTSHQHYTRNIISTFHFAFSRVGFFVFCFSNKIKQWGEIMTFQVLDDLEKEKKTQLSDSALKAIKMFQWRKLRDL